MAGNKDIPHTVGLRRSARLRGIAAAPNASNNEVETNISKKPKTNPKPKRNSASATKPKKAAKQKKNAKVNGVLSDFLPRTREEELLLDAPSLQVIGVDEAGRGPLAGPIVAAAAIVPLNIPGIMDSKKLTKEEVREELYEKIISSPNARWAVAVGDAKRIDEINILQATLECMKNAVHSVMDIPKLRTQGQNGERLLRENEVSSKINGCYVFCGVNDDSGKQIDLQSDSYQNNIDNESYALIDGNRLPKEMPCEAEPMVKGDSREYCIAAASILAKVTRDRLMHEYHALYPEYDLEKHKGYPTAAHMKKVREHGASPIHRRTFAPLKHMVFDKDGNIVEDNS